MQDLIQIKFIQNSLLACLFGGAGLSIIGVYITLMEMPFMGISMSHSAFLGAVGGLLFGMDPVLGALVLCALTGVIIGPLADRTDSSTNNILAIIFTATMGLAFLLLSFIPGPKSEALNLIWGSILTISRREIVFLIIAVSITIALVLFNFKKLAAVMFNREIAATCGISERLYFYGLIFISGMIISASLEIVGGLLLFSLLINPANAAKQLTYSLRYIFLLSASFGVGSCLIGLFLSYLFNVPTGAVIVLTTTMIYLLSVLITAGRK